MMMRARTGVAVCAAGVILAIVPGSGRAQTLRYSNHREVQIPDYALLRIGPFYSNLAFSQSVGYRYSRSSGRGTEYLSDNERGAIVEDGTEFPLISVFTMRNYLLISRRMDLDLSVSASYAYYPRDTQEGGWQVFLPEEGVSVGLSSEFMLTPFVRGTMFDNMLYRTDFVDTRGLTDYYGGERYVYFNNVAGVNLDWLMAKNQNMALSVSREDMLPRDAEFEDQERTSYRESAMYQYELLSGLVVGGGAAFVQHHYVSTGRVDMSQQDYFVTAGLARGAGFPLTDSTTASLKLGYSRAATASRRSGTDETGRDVTASDNPQAEAMSVEVGLNTAMTKEISQTISFSKGLRTGFVSPIERYEGWHYQLGWHGTDASASLWMGLTIVDPEGGGLAGRYDDWSRGVNITLPAGRVVKVTASSTYSDRVNLDNTADGLPLETTADYATWTSTLGVGVPITKSINFNAGVAHIERISDEESLTYTRDVVEATLTYSKQF